MDKADEAAIAGGASGPALMQAAGAAVAVGARCKMRPVTVLCGPGNNGGDGFVAASHLKSAGWQGKLALMGSRDKLSGEAASATDPWQRPIEPFLPDYLDGAGILVDAMFGAGLSRPSQAPRSIWLRR